MHRSLGLGLGVYRGLEFKDLRVQGGFRAAGQAIILCRGIRSRWLQKPSES